MLEFKPSLLSDLCANPLRSLLELCVLEFKPRTHLGPADNLLSNSLLLLYFVKNMETYWIAKSAIIYLCICLTLLEVTNYDIIIIYKRSNVKVQLNSLNEISIFTSVSPLINNRTLNT